MIEDTPTPQTANSEENPFQDIEDIQQRQDFDMRQAAEASRQSVLKTPPQAESTPGFFAKAKEFQENHPVASTVIKLGAAAGIVAGATTVVVNEITQPNATQKAEIEQYNTNQAAENKYSDSIQNAITSLYDQKDVIGEITAQSGKDYLFDSSVQKVIDKIGQDAYTADKGRINKSLLQSTTIYTTQPGEKFEVVETDINPDEHNGKEFITVTSSQIKGDVQDGIPSIQTTTSEQPSALPTSDPSQYNNGFKNQPVHSGGGNSDQNTEQDPIQPGPYDPPRG